MKVAQENDVIMTFPDFYEVFDIIQNSWNFYKVSFKFDPHSNLDISRKSGTHRQSDTQTEKQTDK